MMNFSKKDRETLDEMRKKLTTIGSREATFITIELMFYEAVSLAREYGNDIESNEFLAALKRVEATEYYQSKQLFQKSNQREKVIKRFIAAFKNTLVAHLKKANPQSSAV